MSNDNNKKKYTRFSSAILSKIDSMPMAGEDSPYTALKKETINESELYDHDVYDTEDKDETAGGVAVFIAALVILGIIALAVVTLVKI